MALKDIADEYFRNMNSISSRLYEDIQSIKLSYEDLWDTFSEEEQQMIISENIIEPEIALRYTQYTPKEENTKVEYATKHIFDGHCSYRDEHSGPFSFKTQSQRDLRLFQTDQPKCLQETKAKAPIPKLKINNIPKKVVVYQEPVVEKEVEAPKTNSTNSLPKTGLDFLDNW